MERYYHNMEFLNDDAKKLKAVASKLNCKVITEYDHLGRLVFDHGGIIFVRYNGKGGKWELSASGERNNEVYTDHLSKDLTLKINLSRDKDANKIAQDIEKRLIPDLNKYVTILNQRLKEHDEYVNTRNATMENACMILGLKYPENNNSSENSGFMNQYGKNESYVKFRITSDQVEIQSLTVTLDQLKKIKKILG